MRVNPLLLNEIPQGWVKFRLVDTSILIKDGTHGTHPRIESGIPLLSAKNISETGEIIYNEDDSKIGESEYNKIHRSYHLEVSDLLITVVGSLGRRALVKHTEKFTIQRSVAIIRCNLNLITPKYLYYFTGTDYFQKQFVIRSNSTAQAGLYLGELGDIEISFPSLHEQERITEILDSIDSAIAITDSLIQKLKLMKAGLLNDLLTRGLDENGELRDLINHPEQFQDSPLGKIPKDWKIGQLSDLADVDRGKFTHRPRNDPNFYGGSYPFIQTGDIAKAERGLLKTYSQTLNERGILVSKEFPAGTIAVTIAANIADTAILGVSMFFPDSIVGVIVKNPNNIRYVELTISHNKINLDARAPQSAQKNINLEDLRPLLIAIPNPKEQNKIADIYDAYNNRIIAEEDYLKKLQCQKQGLMNDLLTGKVMVT